MVTVLRLCLEFLRPLGLFYSPLRQVALGLVLRLALVSRLSLVACMGLLVVERSSLRMVSAEPMEQAPYRP